MDLSKYLELPIPEHTSAIVLKKSSMDAPFVDRHYYRVLLDSMVNDLYDPKRKQLKLLEEAWSAAENPGYFQTRLKKPWILRPAE